MTGSGAGSGTGSGAVSDGVRSGQGQGYEDRPNINTGAQNKQHHLINAPSSSLVCD